MGALIDAIIDAINTNNTLGRQNLRDKGVVVAENATTYEIMSAIADVSGGGSASTEQSISDFWNIYQDGGNRVDYSTAFGGVGWNNETFKPKHNMQPTNAYMMFRNSGIVGDLVDILEELGVEIDFSATTNPGYIFNAAKGITRVGKIDVTSSTNSTKADSIFTNCTNLKRIEEFVVNSSTTFGASCFKGCPALEYIGFSGAISNSLSIPNSPLLTVGCVDGIIAHLATVSTKQTLTLDASVSVSEAQKTAISGKNWQLVQ